MYIKGIVTKSTGTWYLVRLEDGIEVECRILGKFRLDGKKITNPVAVGDDVMVEVTGNEAMIKEILPRRNYIARQSPRKKHDLHLLASNVDQAVLISTIVDPDLKPGFIDRFLLTTEPRDIPTILIFNKSDLWGEDDLETFQTLKYIYEKIGYPTYMMSAVDGTNLDILKSVLKDKTTLISGQSGVGKSSLINAIEPRLTLKTGDISTHSGKGQHTTSFAEMHQLSFGGTIIDTPGIKNLSFNNMEVMDVAHNFRELFKLSPHCKFADCTHRNEPGCAIKPAVESYDISPLRYQNYLQILDEIENQNYWERLDM